LRCFIHTGNSHVGGRKKAGKCTQEGPSMQSHDANPPQHCL
jgi:hypothetical protein